MASKKRSKEQARARRQKAKKNKAQKAARIHRLLFKQFTIPVQRQPFEEDIFEYILADERSEYKHHRSILFRDFRKE
jgi:TPR repeat protein